MSRRTGRKAASWLAAAGLGAATWALAEPKAASWMHAAGIGASREAPAAPGQAPAASGQAPAAPARSPAPSSALSPEPPANPSSTPALHFTDVTRSSLQCTLTSGGRPSRQILEVNGGGVALFDADNDGDLDLFAANGATLEDAEHGPGSRLFLNDGTGRFTDVTEAAGIALRRWAMGVAVGDVNGDGYDDLYVTCLGRDVLLVNVTGETGETGERGAGAGPPGRTGSSGAGTGALEGTGASGAGSGALERTGASRTVRFRDATARSGLGDDRWSTSAAFGDVDGDGDLDLYVANYLGFDPRKPPAPDAARFLGVPVMAGPTGLTPQQDILYENDGRGRFRDVTRAWGALPDRAGYGLVAAILDLDGDSRQDIFVGNDTSPSFFFRNEAPRRFREQGAASGLCCNGDGAWQATMGIAVADVNADGLPDVFTTAFSSDSNTLHLNRGGGLFEDRTAQFGLGAPSRPFLSWGAGFYDFDLDGDEDLFVSNGHVYPQAADGVLDAPYEQEPLLFERRGERFVRVGGTESQPRAGAPPGGTDAKERIAAASGSDSQPRAGASGDGDPGSMFRTRFAGRACSFGDLDGDGDPDIVLTTLNGPVRIFRNDAPSTARRLVVRLRQPGGNPRALGAKIELRSRNAEPSGNGLAIPQTRWIHGGSFQSSDASEAYFGLGTWAGPPDGALVLRVTWPDGTTSEHRVPPDRIEIIERPRPSPRR